MAQGKLGFGFMRLPIIDGAQENIDLEQLNHMVDEFLGNGFTYFDTSYAYHNGKSEEALRKSVVERYPREQFTIATKLPTFLIQTEDQVEDIFAQQLKNLGTDYVDYYLLHILNTKFYNGLDGKGGVVKNCHLFLNYIKTTVIEQKVVKVQGRAEAEQYFNYPYNALEETLVNAVFHKSYREPEPVEIRIYVDSIQILNYPGLAKWINLERFVSGKVKGRKYRNRRIGELFKEIDLSEKKGTGIPKILRELKQNGSPEPVFDMDEERTYLNAIIRIRDGFERKEKMSESMSESMSELERARMQIILIYLETNKEINSAAAAKLLEVEIKTASRLLLKAEKLNILKGTGKTKNKVYRK